MEFFPHERYFGQNPANILLTAYDGDAAYARTNDSQNFIFNHVKLMNLIPQLKGGLESLKGFNVLANMVIIIISSHCKKALKNLMMEARKILKNVKSQVKSRAKDRRLL